MYAWDLWWNQATTDVSGVRLKSALLYTRSYTSFHKDGALYNSILRPIAFARRRLTKAEKKKEHHRKRCLRDTVWTWKFHHYYFVREMSLITNHKPVVAIFKKDVATLSKRQQWILLRMHQYKMIMIQAWTR